jgi:hypothetical protein
VHCYQHPSGCDLLAVPAFHHDLCEASRKRLQQLIRHLPSFADVASQHLQITTNVVRVG